MNKLIRKNVLLILIPVISIIYYYFELKTKYNLYYKEYFIFSIIVSFILLLSIYVFKKEKVSFEKGFLIIGIILGLIYIFSSPLFTGGDEFNHYYRIYELSNGTLTTPTKAGPVGSVLPESLYKTFIVNGKCESNCSTSIKYKDIGTMIKIKLEKDNVMQYGYHYKTLYANTALHSFVPYIFQTLGFFIGKTINLNPYHIGMIGRFFNLISYIIICYFGIKKLPRHKLTFMVLLLSPDLFTTACTLSADALTNSVIFLFIANIMNIYYRRKKVSGKEMILLFVLSIIIGASKVVYLPITFLVFLIPYKKISTKKNKYIYCIETTLISTAVNLIWLYFTKPYMSTIYRMTEKQSQMILSAPFNYIKVLCTTFVEEFSHLITSAFAGRDMYHAQLIINPIISIILIVLFVIVLLSDESKKKLNKASKIFIFIVMLVVSVLVCTAIYVQFNANFVMLNNRIVKGLQGRYFMPVLMLMPLIINKKIFKLDEKLILYIFVLLHIPIYLTMFITFIA